MRSVLTEEEALAIARRAIAAGGAPLEPPDKALVLAQLFAVQDLGEREEQANRAAEWSHGMVLWHMARAQISGSAIEWRAAIGWESASSVFSMLAAFVARERDLAGERERRGVVNVRRPTLLAFLLYGVGVGVLLCILLRLLGC